MSIPRPLVHFTEVSHGVVVCSLRCMGWGGGGGYWTYHIVLGSWIGLGSLSQGSVSYYGGFGAFYFYHGL